ncbi:thiamine-phosphate kinase [Oscillatoria laete-virens NRMC-F 0139]|nr:thiamine-phosphate kinase [Oscillatoria laete-virens]MDL5052116.1 thiamine-phosphate kinase [Oscillatoria laete-virens NRMC-F 0139]
MKVREIGEQGLLKRLQNFCVPGMLGDDAAVIATPPGEQLIVTTDMLVDGVHFSDRTTPPEAAGWRAVAANLSDLAAMGATPLGITVGLSLTGETEVAWVEQLYTGMRECLQRYDSGILGGDIVRSPLKAISITALGSAPLKRIIRRNAAQPGDAIVVTGVHGSSRAGLELLLHPEKGENLTQSDRHSLIQAHQRPQPRLDVLPLLWDILPSQSAIAGMDSSDGLADAIIQICQTSNTGASIDRNLIPVSPALTQLVPPPQALQWALYGGEDFELVLCLPPQVAQQFVQRLPTATLIGKITPETEISLVDPQKKYPDEPLALNRGFQHF